MILIVSMVTQKAQDKTKIALSLLKSGLNVVKHILFKTINCLTQPCVQF